MGDKGEMVATIHDGSDSVTLFRGESTVEVVIRRRPFLSRLWRTYAGMWKLGHTQALSAKVAWVVSWVR